MKTNKPNRVHTSGIKASFQKATEYELEGYNLYKNKERAGFSPVEIVEGEGWEEEKSEIDELKGKIIKMFPDNTDGYIFDRIEDLILEFAKNYKG